MAGNTYLAGQLSAPRNTAGRRVAVIGAGYAGLAAAVELSATGHAVDVFEASQTLGGRARAVDLDGLTVDNGQHILAGAYRESLRLMGLVGVDVQQAMLHLPLCLELPGAMRIRAPRWPAPLHLAAALLGAQGLSWAEKWAAARFMAVLGLRRYRLARDITVTELLSAQRQPQRLRQALWEPLCIATLNTAPNEASAQVFVNVLRDTLGAPRRADSDLLLPRTDLSALFPDAAARYVEAHGGTVRRGHRVISLTRGVDGWQIDASATDSHSYGHLILATAPQHLKPLLVPLLTSCPELAASVATLEALQFEPIVTAYLQYPDSVRLAAPMLGRDSGLMQWVFDRGQLGGPAGLLAVVISARGRHQTLDAEALAAALHAELCQMVPGLPTPRWHRVISEKRATFRCTPGLLRLPTLSPLPGLLFAGDHLASDYPATLESAVRSGIAAARAIVP